MSIVIVKPDRDIWINPSSEDCFDLGYTHYGYGWVDKSPEHWNASQRLWYRQGYFEASQDESKAPA